MSGAFSRPTSKHQNKTNNAQDIYDSSTDNPLINIHNDLAFPANQIAPTNTNIADVRLAVNSKSGFVSKNIGRINIEPNQPAERFVQRPDRTRSVSLKTSLSNNLSINNDSSINKITFQSFSVGEATPVARLHLEGDLRGHLAL
jgi:hypothetical protein